MIQTVWNQVGYVWGAGLIITGIDEVAPGWAAKNRNEFIDAVAEVEVQS